MTIRPSQATGRAIRSFRIGGCCGVLCHTGGSTFVKIYIFLSKVKYSLIFGDRFWDKIKRKIELDKFQKTIYIATVLNLAAAALLSEKCGKKSRLCRI
jgi:hypothetical protein